MSAVVSDVGRHGSCSTAQATLKRSLTGAIHISHIVYYCKIVLFGGFACVTFVSAPPVKKSDVR